ncbi:MAG: hypothetical protein V1494_00105 [Candidatus Diapherotrites archaeon]
MASRIVKRKARELEEDKMIWMRYAHEHAVKRGWSEAHELIRKK